jgi:hypothetical protein
VSDDYTLQADASGVAFYTACTHAVFPSVTLDGARSFVVESTSYALQSMLSLDIAIPNGSRVRLNGRVSGAHLQLTITYVHAPDPDYVVQSVTLRRHGHTRHPVCTA